MRQFTFTVKVFQMPWVVLNHAVEFIGEGTTWVFGWVHDRNQMMEDMSERNVQIRCMCRSQDRSFRVEILRAIGTFVEIDNVAVSNLIVDQSHVVSIQAAAPVK